LHGEAKISSRHASILKQFAVALELFNKKSLEYQLLVWPCEQLQAETIQDWDWDLNNIFGLIPVIPTNLFGILVYTDTIYYLRFGRF
jgi:hypothetical protein